MKNIIVLFVIVGFVMVSAAPVKRDLSEERLRLMLRSLLEPEETPEERAIDEMKMVLKALLQADESPYEGNGMQRGLLDALAQNICNPEEQNCQEGRVGGAAHLAGMTAHGVGFSKGNGMQRGLIGGMICNPQKENCQDGKVVGVAQLVGMAGFGN